MSVPLSVLDLVPIASGSDPSEAIGRSIDLVRRTEELGYRRYWFAEHHLNPGVAGTSPVVLIGLAAAASTRIRVGSGGVQMGHRTPLSVVEEFGLLDAIHPGRIDLGMGRSGSRGFLGGRGARRESGDRPGPPASTAPALPSALRTEPEVVDGLVLPPRFPVERLFGSPRIALQANLLQQPSAETPRYCDQVGEVLDLLAGTYTAEGGGSIEVVPGGGAAVEVWVLGSSAGESAVVAGQRGLRFAANYHVSPATVLEAVDGYRSAFCPSADLEKPYVSVSADVVVAEDDETARELATGYGLWVRSIRTGEGAVRYPTPTEAATHAWSEEDRALVADRVTTQFVGSPGTVVEALTNLQRVTGADELAITTMTHDHADRVRSYALLAEAWGCGEAGAKRR
ncbi:MAG: LLM class flavin-dependent oxidoreductase [Acidimicrobiales bacterium]|jgi:alkanesulfonate monooxygenase SsuD/methylene tetrahydromethanopterin reductase-like flavin-dependent oxidoreductase (luciferase family)